MALVATRNGQDDCLNEAALAFAAALSRRAIAYETGASDEAVRPI